jgi:hypothetical protein
MDDGVEKTYEQELVDDMITLMSSFSSRIYGRRSAENRKARKCSHTRHSEKVHRKPEVSMILTYKVRHHQDFSTQLRQAKQVAKFAIANRDKLSSKHVAHFGLTSN